MKAFSVILAQLADAYRNMKLKDEAGSYGKTNKIQQVIFLKIIKIRNNYQGIEDV